MDNLERQLDEIKYFIEYLIENTQLDQASKKLLIVKWSKFKLVIHEAFKAQKKLTQTDAILEQEITKLEGHLKHSFLSSSFIHRILRKIQSTIAEEDQA